MGGVGAEGGWVGACLAPHVSSVKARLESYGVGRCFLALPSVFSGCGGWKFKFMHWGD